ncbi:MAG: Rieske (2Fe-2S) protein [Pirellulaceae bacterium]|jgi:cytochrome b6-f complex iron-sulfur subunit|nr:Rieske (2Fe-2S) protein [Pirellulaceae bacterium]
MANKDKMSIEEMLASARASDGASKGADPLAEAADSTETPAKAAPANKPASGKKPGQMSVEEMLAAARGEKSEATGVSDTSAAAPAKPAAAGSKKKPGQMSVEEMLAAARGEKSAAAAPAKPAAKVVAKSAAKAGVAKKAAKGSPAKASGPKDTASILAAARSSKKPGPISKAEAAAQGKTLPAGKKKLEAPPMPAKPAYAKTPAGAGAQADRRGFLALTIASVGIYLSSAVGFGFGTLIVTNLLWLLGTARFMFPNILTEPPTKFKVGFPDDLAPGQVASKFKAQFGVWIVRTEYDGVPQIVALQSVCTHLGCTPNWLEGEQKFKCPCHGSGFYKDGVNFEGPAPRPLERYAIRLADDGQLEVDKSRTYKEEIGQWANTASYVTV